MRRDMTPCTRCARGWVPLSGSTACVLRHKPACASVRARKLAAVDAALDLERRENEQKRRAS